MLESFLFDNLSRGVQESYSFGAVGSENMEVFGRDDCVGFSSITRDLVNHRHNESRS